MKLGFLRKATMFVRDCVLFVVGLVVLLIGCAFILLCLYDLFTDFDYREWLFELYEKANRPHPREIMQPIIESLR